VTERVVVLTGGVGGAKLVEGLNQIVAPDMLTAIVNVGDDFTHLGLHVSPDIDTLLYTLSGKANQAQGWGREGESWTFMQVLRELGGEDWFLLGDGDLALHIMRTDKLRSGTGLADITRAFAQAWGLHMRILPASEQAITTCVETDAGLLEFQRYFVEKRCIPIARSIGFRGAQHAAPGPHVIEAIGEADIILVAPSNPYLSIDPILAIPEIRMQLEMARAPVIAVSPLIAGQAVKGPTTKIMQELGVPSDNFSIADHYRGLIDGLLVNLGDPAPEDLSVARTDTMMRSAEDRGRVAQAALALARQAVKR
jgi:LPPG:FO 2-phospho-L-lactate transferase